MTTRWDKINEPLGHYGKQYTKYWYCPFCRKAIEEPIILEMKKAYNRGRYKNVNQHLNLCPTCGGTVISQARPREVIPHIGGTMRIHRGKEKRI